MLRFELVPVVHGSKRESFDVAVREFPSTGCVGFGAIALYVVQSCCFHCLPL